MLRLTEHFGGGLPTQVKPLWLDGYVSVETNDELWNELKDDNEILENQMMDFSSPKTTMQSYVSSQVIYSAQTSGK
jgi:hypothetical protein